MLKVLKVSYCDHAVSVVCPYGHSFASIFMKLHQNVCLDDVLVRFEYGSCRIKN